MKDPSGGRVSFPVRPRRAQGRLETRERIPVKQEALGPCGPRGPGPLDAVDGGKLAVFCPHEDAGGVLSSMKGRECGMDAAIEGDSPGREQGGPPHGLCP